jgi:hypothetical protein
MNKLQEARINWKICVNTHHINDVKNRMCLYMTEKVKAIGIYESKKKKNCHIFMVKLHRPQRPSIFNDLQIYFFEQRNPKAPISRLKNFKIYEKKKENFELIELNQQDKPSKDLLDD